MIFYDFKISVREYAHREYARRDRKNVFPSGFFRERMITPVFILDEIQMAKDLFL